MTHLVDLTAEMDPEFRKHVPSDFARFDKIVAPEITYLRPEVEGRDIMMSMYGCPPEHLPDGEGYGSDLLLEMTTNCGTHVDAPLHSGRLIEGKPARTMSDIDLSKLYAPGLVLDVREWVEPSASKPCKRRSMPPVSR